MSETKGRGRARTVLLIVGGVAFGLIAMLVVLGAAGIFLFRAALSDKGPLDCTRAVPVPDGSAAARAAWAEAGMGSAYTGVAAWVQRSTFIASRVGPVRSVAPIGAPNCTRDFFTDGRFADLHLEVVGERKTATFEVKSSQVLGPKSVVFGRATLTDDTGSIAVSDSDRSLAEFESPAYQVEHWTKLIDRDPKHVYRATWESRAKAYFALGEARSAAADQASAIAAFSRQAETSVHGTEGGKDAVGWTDASRGDLRRMVKVHARYLEAAGDYGEASEAWTRALELPLHADDSSAKRTPELTADHLAAWVPARHAHGGTSANAELRGRLDRARRGADVLGADRRDAARAEAVRRARRGARRQGEGGLEGLLLRDRRERL